MTEPLSFGALRAILTDTFSQLPDPHLSAVLVTLMLLASLCHTVCSGATPPTNAYAP